MKVFITGATGFLGPALIKTLQAKGHSVLALARSDGSEQTLKAAKCEILRGSITDLEVLKEGAKTSDAVIHLAFGREFLTSDDLMGAYMKSVENDKNAVAAIGDALVGTSKPFTMASVYAYEHGVSASETTAPATKGLAAIRQAGATVCLSYKDKGVNCSIIRIPPVLHDIGDDAGFIKMYIAYSKKLGFVPTFAGGKNHWLTVHRSDVSRLFLLAIEKGTPGATYHSHTEVVEVNEISNLVSKVLRLPIEDKPVDQAPKLLGILGTVIVLDILASNEITKKELNYHAQGIPLLEDIEKNYF